MHSALMLIMMKKITIPLILIMLLSSCSHDIQQSYPQNRQQKFKNKYGNFLQNKQQKPAAKDENRKRLFNMAVRLFDESKLTVKDARNYFIATDWLTLKEPNTRYKADIKIIGDSITEDSIKIKVFTQQKTDGVWAFTDPDPEIASNLVERIIYKAHYNNGL